MTKCTSLASTIYVECVHLDLKGTVSREKLFIWGLGEMDWTQTIDRTRVLHFSDQLFSSYKILTVCRLEVKPVWWLSETVALRRLIVHAVVALSSLIVCCCCSPHTNCAVVAVRTPILCCCCSTHTNTVRTATFHCYSRNQLTHVIISVLSLQSADWYCADCNNSTLLLCWLQLPHTNKVQTATGCWLQQQKCACCL